MKPLCIFGAGGCGREVLLIAQRLRLQVEAFIEPAPAESVLDTAVRDESFFNPQLHSAAIALGSPAERCRLARLLTTRNPDTEFPVLIDPGATLLHPSSIVVGHGSIISAHCNLTCNILLGSWSLINVGTYLGHDLHAGDFFTTAYGVNVSGRNWLGHRVMLGAGVSTRDNVFIGDDVLVGVGAAVVKDLAEPGVYVGVPARKLE